MTVKPDLKVFKVHRVLLDLRENLAHLVLMEKMVLLDHLEQSVHQELKAHVDLQATLTSMISSLLDPKVTLDQLDLLVLPDHQDLLVPSLAAEAPLKSDQAWEATDHFCMDLADHQDLQDSQDQKVTWDFQELWDQMERWAHKVSKVFQVEMVHQEPVVKLDPED